MLVGGRAGSFFTGMVSDFFSSRGQKEGGTSISDHLLWPEDANWVWSTANIAPRRSVGRGNCRHSFSKRGCHYDGVTRFVYSGGWGLFTFPHFTFYISSLHSWAVRLRLPLQRGTAGRLLRGRSCDDGRAIRFATEAGESSSHFPILHFTFLHCIRGQGQNRTADTRLFRPDWRQNSDEFA